MNVFISYGSPSDQVTALRLQALGAVNSLRVYVPPAHTRHAPAPLLDAEIGQKLREAEVVLGVIGAELSEGCRQELNTGRATGQEREFIALGTLALGLLIFAPLSSTALRCVPRCA